MSKENIESLLENGIIDKHLLNDAKILLNSKHSLLRRILRKDEVRAAVIKYVTAKKNNEKHITIQSVADCFGVSYVSVAKNYRKILG